MADFKKKLKVPKNSDRKGDLPETQEDWVSYINNLHDRSLWERRKHEAQWVVNLAYYLGYQNLVFEPSSGIISFSNNEKIPLSINRIGSFIEARHAKLTKNRPTTRVIPNTNELADLRGAKNADKALQCLWRKIDMDDEYDKLVMQALICGTSFMKNVWDPHAGDYVRETKESENEDEILLDEDTGELAEDKIFLGEVCSKVRSAFQVLVASENITAIHDQPWIIERNHMNVLDLEKLYPHLKGKIKKEDRFEAMTDYERIVQRLASPVFASNSNMKSKLQDSANSEALVKTFWMKPNHQFEKGLVAVVVGDQLAYIDIFPNDYGERNCYPIVKFSEKNSGFHFWNQATVERLIPIQKMFNKLRDKTLQNAFDMGSLKWLLAKGSQVSEESLTDEVGEIVEYNPSVPPPKPAEISPLPNYIQALPNDLIADFRDVGGQREASVAPPPQLTAAVALQVAAEQADEVIGPILRRVAKSMEFVAEQQLLLMNQEYDEPRKIKILGNGSVADVQWMSKIDLNNSTDVHIEVESMYPDFRGQKRETLLSLWDRRIITDPQQMLRAYRFGNYDEILDKQDKADDAVKLDIQRIKKGKEPEISPFQNHISYVKEMSEWIQTPDFLKLIPERKQLAIAVLQAHLQFLQPSLPNGGEPMGEQNQAAVETAAGPQVPAG